MSQYRVLISKKLIDTGRICELYLKNKKIQVAEKIPRKVFFNH